MANVQRILSCFLAAFLAALLLNLVACVDSPPGGFDDGDVMYCDDDNDCVGNDVCNVPKGLCVDPDNNDHAPQGDACTRNTDCNGDNVCTDGRCIDPDDDNNDDGDDECDDDNDCDSGEECDDGRCVDEDDNASTDQTEEERTVDVGVEGGELIIKFESPDGLRRDFEINGGFIEECADTGTDFGDPFLDEVAGNWGRLDRATNTSNFRFHLNTPADAKYLRFSLTAGGDWDCEGFQTQAELGNLTAEFNGDELTFEVYSLVWCEGGEEVRGCGHILYLPDADSCDDDVPRELDITRYGGCD